MVLDVKVRGSVGALRMVTALPSWTDDANDDCLKGTGSCRPRNAPPCGPPRARVRACVRCFRKALGFVTSWHAHRVGCFVRTRPSGLLRCSGPDRPDLVVPVVQPSSTCVRTGRLHSSVPEQVCVCTYGA